MTVCLSTSHHYHHLSVTHKFSVQQWDLLLEFCCIFSIGVFYDGKLCLCLRDSHSEGWYSWWPALPHHATVDRAAVWKEALEGLSSQASCARKRVFFYDSDLHLLITEMAVYTKQIKTMEDRREAYNIFRSMRGTGSHGWGCARHSIFTIWQGRPL